MIKIALYAYDADKRWYETAWNAAVPRRSESFYRKLFTHSKNNFGQKTILYTWWSNIIFLGCWGSNSNRLFRSILGAGISGPFRSSDPWWFWWFLLVGFLLQADFFQKPQILIKSWSKVWRLRWNKEYFVRTCWTKYPLLQHIPIAKFIIGQGLRFSRAIWKLKWPQFLFSIFWVCPTGIFDK